LASPSLLGRVIKKTAKMLQDGANNSDYDSNGVFFVCDFLDILRTLVIIFLVVVVVGLLLSLVVSSCLLNFWQLLGGLVVVVVVGYRRPVLRAPTTSNSYSSLEVLS
jgi:hypothetical protein